MENLTGFGMEELELPPGFRFHPTDEELISHYLSPKVLDSDFCTVAIGEVDLNKVEPWELPWRAKMGEKEWYFFCVRDRKYPTGTRTNRATEAGYWKATGKDKEIFKAKTLVGMKKTLVFYRGRAPKGEKTNWVIHEYRLDGKFSINNLPETAKSEWVISRIFHKTSGGKKIPISGLTRMNNYGQDFGGSNLPPLMDLSSFDGQTATTNNNGETSHVTCFSDSMEDQKPHEDVVESFTNSFPPPSSSKANFDNQNSFFSTQLMPNVENLQFQEPVWMQDQSVLRFLIDQSNMKAEYSPDTDMSSGVISHGLEQRCYEVQDYQIDSAGPIDLDCLWNY